MAIEVNYDKLSIEGLADLVVYIGSKAEKFDFTKFVEIKPKETKLVNVLDAEGKPEYYVNKKGKTVIKKKRITISNETKEVFNLLKAKRAFFEEFKNEENIKWLNAPKEKKKKDDTKKTETALGKLGVTLKK